MAAKALEILIDEFNKLPGIGRKNAVRLAFYILNTSQEDVDHFVEALKNVKSSIKKCKVCGNYSENDVCDICSDMERDNSIVCIVEESRDILSFEKTGKYNGKYHVLNGKIEPLKGITPDKLNISSLLDRIANNDIKEVILALNPDFDGDITSSYLIKILRPFGIKITKIASGIPSGGNIEFSDIATISRALDSRHEV